ncbi:MAG: NAD(P)H-quinone oxidoreductase, partial [Deltaproteobacteria bacterium]|nr:NAD(P)H-quinone oxidoreductase [Deltaproteobacteria bacterium]
MRAVICQGAGGPEVLTVGEVPSPVLTAGCVRIRVAATALNRADLLQRRGFYPAPPGESEILGLECAGVVVEAAPDVTAVRVGDRVMALLGGGGYAEEVVVHEKMAIPVPEPLTLEQAAAIPEAFLTAREALFSLGAVRPGDTVLIHAAAGGVGSAAVELAHLAGARVVATVGSAEKAEVVTALGADRVVCYRDEDFAPVVKEVSAGAGASVVLDFVGASYFPRHAACTAIGGRIVVIGVLGGASAEVNLAQLLMRRLQILGLVMRSRPLAEKIA